MSPKKLLPLVIILAVLAVLALWKRSTEVTPSLVDQVQLEPMAPTTLSTEDITRIELYAGADPEAKVLLEKQDADAWVVSSHYNAPAEPIEVLSFLDALLALRGEYRADAEDPAAREPYGLNEDQAFHVAAYASDAETPAVHLLIGNTPRPRTVFMRRNAEDAVYIETTSLREEAGVFGDDLAMAPQPNKWMDLRIVDMPEDAIARLAVETPDRRWTFEREILEPPTADTAEDADAADAEAPDEPDEPIVQWRVVEGGLGEHRVTGLETLLRRFTALDAADIVDPDTLEAWGLDAPGYRITLLDENDAEVVLEAGRPEPNNSGYLRVAGAEPAIVYEVSNSRFNQLFPAASQLFHLPELDLEPDSISRIEIEAPDAATLAASHDGEAWQVESPVLTLPVNQSNLNRLRNTVAEWSPADYADPDTDTGDFTHALRFWADGVERRLEIAGDAQIVDGVYARLDDQPEVLIMARREVEQLFPDLSAVYARHIFGDRDIDYEAIDIAYEGQDWTFRLDEDESLWTLEIDGEPQQVISNTIEELYFSLTGLQGAEIIPNAYPDLETPWEAVMRIRLGGAADERVALIGPEDAEGRYPVRVPGASHGLPLTSVDFNRIVTHLEELLAMDEAVEEGEVTLEELEAEAEAEAVSDTIPMGVEMPQMPEGVQIAPPEAGGMPAMPGVQGAPQGGMPAPPEGALPQQPAPQQPMPQQLPEGIELPEGVELAPPPADDFEGAAPEVPIVIEP